MQHVYNVAHSLFVFSRSTFCWEDARATLRISRREVITAQAYEQMHRTSDPFINNTPQMQRETAIGSLQFNEENIDSNNNNDDDNDDDNNNDYNTLNNKNNATTNEYGIKPLVVDVSVVRDGRPAGKDAESIDASLVYSGDEVSLQLHRL